VGQRRIFPSNLLTIQRCDLSTLLARATRKSFKQKASVLAPTAPAERYVPTTGNQSFNHRDEVQELWIGASALTYWKGSDTDESIAADILLPVFTLRLDA